VNSRRAFLAHGLALMAGSALLAGCRRTRSAVADDRAPAPAGVIEPQLPGSPMPDGEPVMRVRVLRIGPGAGEGRIALGAAGQALRVRHLRYGGEGVEVAAPVTVEAAFGGWVLREATGRITEAEGIEELAFEAKDGAAIELLPRGRRYPGAVHLTWRSEDGEGAFDVVNHVPLERYLPGVLASELYGHWEAAAYRAQAIAARSFACSEHAYFRSRRHFDVSDTVSSQVYAGEVDRRKAEEAASTTRGIVLGYEGRLVPGYYSSCCGGLAARARDVIGPNVINTIAPLDGRDGEDVCTGAPVYSWTVERSKRRLIERMQAYGAYRGIKALEGLDGLEAIEVAARNEHGRPTMYRLMPRADTADGLFELDAERLLGAAAGVRARRGRPMP